jgi:hypothetical protein
MYTQLTFVVKALNKLEVVFYSNHSQVITGNKLFISCTNKHANTIGNFSIYKQRRPEACIILQQCTRRSYYLPVYFHIEGAILFEKSDNKKIKKNNCETI